jgi:hypothetical protein
MSNRNNYLFATIIVATMLFGSLAMADIVHREFSEDNRMVKVRNDDWQPKGFDTGRDVPATYVARADITLDGRDTEPEWATTPEVTVKMNFGNVSEASVKALYTDTDVLLRVRWADSTMDREHRPWVWNARQNQYVAGPQIEDSLLVSFEAGCEWNPSLLAGYPFDFDGWNWLAARSDPVGQAWDLIGNMSRPWKNDLDEQMYDSRSHDDSWILKFQSVGPDDDMNFAPWDELDRNYLYWPTLPKVTMTRHLDRMGSDEDASVLVPPPVNPPGDGATVFPRVKAVKLEGAAGEVAAKGHWEDGYWTVEFRRVRITPDNIINDTMFNRLTQFALYIFDHVERFDEASESERLYLKFMPPERHLVSN